MELTASKNETNGRWTLEGVEPSEVTFQHMCKMLREKINFKFARYGDGEFMCMSGHLGCNKDKHEFFPELGSALNDAFYSNPKYMVGIQPLSVQGGLYQRATGDDVGPKNIYDADVLHSASIDGRLNEFFKAIEGRKVLVVGPPHLMRLKKKLLPIPEVNCWKQYQEIRELLWFALQDDRDVVVLLCASMMSEVLIYHFQDYPHTFIDAGSVFDPYCGKFTRSYHHKLHLNGH